MKAVLLSVQPRWCEHIASGKKTVEVRKTRPKLKAPFKVYIYCTKGEYLWLDKGRVFLDGKYNRIIDNLPERLLNSRVIGEFVCDEIYPIKVHSNCAVQNWNWFELSRSCLSLDEVAKYIGANKTGYGWHISNLVIYDKPKKLSEFYNYDPTYNNAFGWAFSEEEKRTYLKRPPQSWCYVEELSE